MGINIKEINTINYRIRRPDGDYIWFESTTTPIHHPDISVVEEIVAILGEITEIEEGPYAEAEGRRNKSEGDSTPTEEEPLNSRSVGVLNPCSRWSLSRAEDSIPSASCPRACAFLDKQAEEALRESECQCQTLTDNVPGMIFQFLRRTDGCVSFPFVSSGAREIYELEPAQIQQNAEAVIDLIHPDDRDSFEDSIAISAKTLQPWRWNGRVVLASGKLKWLQAVSRPELQANGDILWEGMLMEITQSKHSKAAFQESQQQFRSTLEQADIAIAQVGTKGQFLRVNQKLCEITGYSQDELLKKTIVEITYLEDRAADEMYLRQLISGQRQTLNCEKRYIHKTGSLVWVNVALSPVREPTGALKYFIGAIEDITQRKEAQEALRRREEHFRSLIENASDIITILNRDGTISYESPSIKRILGYAPEELVGLNVFELVHPEDSQRVNQSLCEVLQSVSCGLSVEFRFRHQDGSWHTLEAMGKSLVDEVGEMTILLNSRDITERKQAEAELLEGTRLSALTAKVGVALAHGGRLPVILEYCTEAIVQQLNVTSAAVWTLNSASQKLEQQAASGESLPLNPDFINLVAQTREPYLSSKPVEELHSSLPPPYFSGYPLIVEDQLLGVMTLLGNQPLAEEARGILSWVANAIAVAIDRYWARTELLSRRESLLFELANQIRNSLELDTILETTVQSIRSLLQIDQCQFLWYRPHEIAPYWEVVNEASNPLLPSDIREYTIAHVGPFAARLLNRQIIQVDDLETLSDSTLRQFLLAQGYSSLLSIPIETETGKIGVINCAHCTGARPWNNSEVELLQAVVAQVARAIEQAELYAEARKAADVAEEKAKQLELALHKLQATQAQLVQSEKMSSLGQLVAGVAHEINNPINFIHNNLNYASAYFYDLLSLLHLYQENFPNPPTSIREQAELINIEFIAKDLPKLLSSMQRGTDRIRSIVLSLRNFSRVDEARMKKVDLHEGIENTLLILQHRLKGKGENPDIQVFKEYGELPPVECYPGQLNQVFMNILSNAIDVVTQSGVGSPEDSSPRITIRTTILDSSESAKSYLYPFADQHPDKTQNSQSVVIRIADNGPGMTEEVKRRLFDPFFTTKPVGQGIGLGLSISYQIVVEHHHGFLTCTSAPGQGTEFWIEIPLQQKN